MTATAAPSPIPSLPAALPATRAPAASLTSAPVSITPAATSRLIGEWDFRADAGQGVIAGTLRFRAQAAGLGGTYAGLRGNTTELSNVRLSGDRISFDLVAPRGVWHLEGAVSGDRIEGTFQTAERSIPWSAVRRPPAVSETPIHRP